MTERTRDTKTWYLERDHLALVDPGLVEAIHAEAGREILDLGCGPGGYARVLQDRGHLVRALDINPEYVAMARSLGVAAEAYDGQSIPLPDASVDTVILVEVLEHVRQPEALMREVARVTRGNLIVTVPNCSWQLRAPVVPNHMLDVDHVNFFTTETLRALLCSSFTDVTVREVSPLDDALARDVLPRWAHRLYRMASKIGLLRPRFHFRMIATARIPT